MLWQPNVTWLSDEREGSMSVIPDLPVVVDPNPGKKSVQNEGDKTQAQKLDSTQVQSLAQEQHRSTTTDCHVFFRDNVEFPFPLEVYS